MTTTTTKTTLQSLKEQFPDIAWRRIPPPEAHPAWKYPGFAPGTTTLPAGHVKAEGHRAFGVDTVWERDVAIPMRDGAKLYADVFRPASSSGGDKVPVIIAWSPYGKVGGPMQYATMGPFNCGVDNKLISGYQVFEGPDPADWAERGYAVLHVDARGAGHSESDIVQWGPQEAEDVYDTISWAAQQEWCSGAVVMAGNSWFAVAQLNFASRFQHPALKAIAPWEGLTDVYKDVYLRGGFPHQLGFTRMVPLGMAGPGHVEDVGPARASRPLYDAFWATKRAAVENINVPMYVTASYSSSLHTRGSFEAFERAATRDKWLRVHPYQEWHDAYRPAMVDDLQAFFDRYAKSLPNGWEETPRVRLSLLAFDGSPEPTVIERPHETYPVPGTTRAVYHLDAASHALAPSPPSAEARASHEGHSLTATSDFTVKFDVRTEIAGYARVRLWMSYDHDAEGEMDVVVQLRKIDADGNLLTSVNFPVPVTLEEFHKTPTNVTNVSTTLGAQGQLRASHAVSRVDPPPGADEGVVEYAHDKAEKVAPGQIVPLDIGFWPMGMVFGPGESIMLRVAGHNLTLPETAMLALKEPEDTNVGTHNIYTGGRYDSYLVLPILPQV